MLWIRVTPNVPVTSKPAEVRNEAFDANGSELQLSLHLLCAWLRCTSRMARAGNHQL